MSSASMAQESNQTALDPGLAPDQEALSEQVSPVYQEMGIIQKKAIQKSGKFLFSTFWSMDFSDGPQTLYSVNFNPGYAINDYFEIYANYVPTFASSERDVVGKVNSLILVNGQRATIVAAKPQKQYGLDLVWSPLYGKDSLGLSRIVRSDTFFKFGVGQIQYDGGNGMRYVGGIGKTFFMSKVVGVRLVIDAGNIETIVDQRKSFHWMALMEAGLVLYL